MKAQIRELKYIYALEPIDDWFGWTPLAKMNFGELRFFDFGIKSLNLNEELSLFFKNNPYEFSENIDFGELKDFAERFLYLIGADKEFIRSEKSGEFNINEMTDEGWLYYTGIPKDEYYCPHIILSYKIRNNGTTYIGTPFRLSWLDKISINPIRDIVNEEKENEEELNNQFENATIKQAIRKTEELLEVIEQEKIRKDNNIELVGWLHNLSDLDYILKKYGIEYKYDKKWEQIYFRDYEGEKITDIEIKELKNYLTTVNQLVKSCDNNMKLQGY